VIDLLPARAAAAVLEEGEVRVRVFTPKRGLGVPRGGRPFVAGWGLAGSELVFVVEN
jgi:hypothetical protein